MRFKFAEMCPRQADGVRAEFDMHRETWVRLGAWGLPDRYEFS